MSNNVGEIIVERHGLVPFKKMWDYQTGIHQQLVELKRANKDSFSENRLIFCSHPHVYTLGKSGKEHNLKLGQEELVDKGIEFYKINRGGDITYHGPGQLVVYPIIDLELIGRDVHRYIRTLEQIVIDTLAKWGIKGQPYESYTGVWVEQDGWKKICALGVHLSRWVSMHGIALNVNTDLSKFNHIIPCGINEADKDICSMSSLLEREITITEVINEFIDHFETRFNLKTIELIGKKYE